MGFMETKKTTKPHPAELRNRAVSMVRKHLCLRTDRTTRTRSMAHRWVPARVPRSCDSPATAAGQALRAINLNLEIN
jgi:hypothetical protein